ncbi:hypothetical protein [Streptomyces sannanensis]
MATPECTGAAEASSTNRQRRSRGSASPREQRPAFRTGGARRSPLTPV